MAQITKSPLGAQAAAAAGILSFSVRLLLPQLLMCGTGDINVQDFKAHAVIVGGLWHFREKVSHEEVRPRRQRWAVANVSERHCFFCLAGDEVVLGRGVQLHSGRVGPSVAVHHRLLPAAPRRIQHPLPLLPDHRRPDAQHPAHCTHVVSRKTREVLRQRSEFPQSSMRNR